MKKIALPASFLALLACSLGVAPTFEEHPSLTSEVLATYEPAHANSRTAADMAAAAKALLEALGDERRAESTFALDSSERSNWTNVPPGADEPGVRLGDLDRGQLERACDLLATVLSRQGYDKVRDILLADDKLLRDGRPRVGFGAENYWLVLFGTPSADGAWGLQLDGHHIGVNVSFDGGEVSLSPSFIGTQPSAYERDGAEIVPLRGEVDYAFALVSSLSDEQRAKAIVKPKRGRIAAGAGRDGFVPEPSGLECDGLDETQRGILLELIRAYVANLPEPFAGRRLDALDKEVHQMTFAWSGPTENPSDVSYRLLGPTLIIEYACQDLGGDPLDHLHSIYRNPKNEYGAGF